MVGCLTKNAALSATCFATHMHRRMQFVLKLKLATCDPSSHKRRHYPNTLSEQSSFINSLAMAHTAMVAQTDHTNVRNRWWHKRITQKDGGKTRWWHNAMVAQKDHTTRTPPQIWSHETLICCIKCEMLFSRTERSCLNCF